MYSKAPEQEAEARIQARTLRSLEEENARLRKRIEKLVKENVRLLNRLNRL